MATRCFSFVDSALQGKILYDCHEPFISNGYARAMPTAIPPRKDQTAGNGTCHLCGSAMAPQFKAEILSKYDVGYFRCDGCGSLQTEPPHWLGEAYASNLGDRDCGAAQRNLSNFAVCLALAKIWGVRNAIDHGGGDGLLTRMLRDYGIKIGRASCRERVCSTV